MDLLSLVNLATKRRSDYITQAKTLAKKYSTQPSLENQMAKESRLLVTGLRDKLMRWDEYERSLIDKTLTSALAAFIQGVGDDKADQKIEKAWPIIVGDMLPPLTKFLAETKEYIDDGTLRLGDQTLDFRDYDLAGAIPGAMDLETDEIDGINPEEAGVVEADQSRAQGSTWPALFSRVIRYLANPTFSFFNLGSYMRVQDMGYKEMIRVAKHDKKVCKDCKEYDEMGWQPIGTLPMPGKGCRCYDRCRCVIDYR
jgi:hypothetical protein